MEAMKEDGAANPGRSPTPACPTAASSDEAKYDQQHDRAYERVNDQCDDPHAEMDVKPRQQPITNKSSQQADDHVSDQAETRASHHLACEPSGNEADEKNDQEALIRQMHVHSSK
jgi:hypothetical protein